MSREARDQVLGRLRAVRRELYRQLAEQVGTSGERALVNRAGDLLLAEEILLENGDDLDEPDKPGRSVNKRPDQEIPDVPGDWDVVGEFSRLPRGGVIIDRQNEAEVFVPEAAVRREGIAHGDTVGARRKGISDRGAPLYYFQVLERKGRGDEAGRVSLVAPLEFRGGNWGVFDEDSEQFITVPDGDVHVLGVEEGDLVEVAYPTGDLAAAKLAWKYDVLEPFVQVREPRKDTKRGKKPRAGAEDEPPDLLGRTVLVVGADSYKESFKRVFERRGAVFMWESGFMVGKFLESKVCRADIVVIVTEAMKHKMPDVEAICVRHGRPYVYAPSRGASGALRAVFDRLAET